MGAEAYAFAALGDEVTFASSPRKLGNVAVTLSSSAFCAQGHWDGVGGLCSTPSGATFSQPITLSIYDVGSDGVPLGTQIASATQTFNIPYRPRQHDASRHGRVPDFVQHEPLRPAADR